MEWQYTPYTIPVGLLSVESAVLAAYILRNRRTPGAVPFGVLLLMTGLWMGSYALELASTSLAAKAFFSRLVRGICG